MSAERGIVDCRADPLVVVFDVAAPVGGAAVGVVGAAGAAGAGAGVAAGFVSLGSEMDSSNNKSIAIRESADTHFYVCCSEPICHE